MYVFYGYLCVFVVVSDIVCMFLWISVYVCVREVKDRHFSLIFLPENHI